MRQAESRDDIVCSNCGKTLRHDKGYCPLFPEVRPPTNYGKAGKKWGSYVCFIHTCYDLKEVLKDATTRD